MDKFIINKEKSFKWYLIFILQGEWKNHKFVNLDNSNLNIIILIYFMFLNRIYK